MKIKDLCRQIPENSQYFPSEVFNIIRDQGLLQLNLPKSYQKISEKYFLYKTLFEIGKASLSVGRIYEGHINAIKLINDLGSTEQKDFYFAEVKKGKLFSVWNTEIISEALTGEIKHDCLILKGAKIFCSGGLHIDYALITAKIEGAKQLIIIPLKAFPALKEDYSLWHPMGMKNSVSCRIDFTNLAISSKNRIGGKNDYELEPWFTGGAIRFASVQLGGAEAVMNAAQDHLKNLNRVDDPYQQQRFGLMAVQIESGKLWLEKAQNLESQSEQYSKEEIVNFANMMRSAVLEICEKILQLSERSVGVQGFMNTHALDQVYRDLKVYLKQPGPDFALQNVGAYYLNDFKR